MSTELADGDAMQTDAGSWWLRACGGREVVRLALPLVISTASWAVMNFIDRMFLLWHSQAAMAAVLPAGMVHFTMLCFPLGIATYVNTFVAQYYGAGRYERIGAAVWQGLIVAAAAFPFFLLSIPLAPWLFGLAQHDPEVERLEIVYFQIVACGGGAAVCSAALSSFFTGRGEMRTVMVVDSGAALLNVVLDYAWIFGHLGFPAWGMAGAAWATVVCQWCKVLVYWWLVHRPANEARFQLAAGRRLELDLLRRLLRHGGVNGLQMGLEVGAFTLFCLLIGYLGQEAMAATTLAFNVNSVAFIPMLGLGLAVSTLVGQQLGAGRPDRAARGTWTALVLAMGYMSFFALLYLAMPDLLLAGYAAGVKEADFHSLRETVTVLLRFMAAFAVFDAANVIFVSAIKGAGDTRFILVVTIVTSPVPLVVGWLGILAGGGLYWCWWVLTGWICTLGIVFFLRFQAGHWRTMRVIESEPADALPAVDEAPLNSLAPVAGDLVEENRAETAGDLTMAAEQPALSARGTNGVYEPGAGK